MKVSGTFHVTMNPLEAYASGAEGATLGRMSIDKTFEGELQATSQGEMLSAMTPVKGSAGYVAIEQVTGNLAGKEGSFVLQHFGTMGPDGQRLILEVLPDSGTGRLRGLTGTMTIDVKDGKHYYAFEYELLA